MLHEPKPNIKKLQPAKPVDAVPDQRCSLVVKADDGFGKALLKWLRNQAL